MPKTAYDSLVMLIWKGWQFGQRVTPRVGTIFSTLEAALRDDFLPALLGGSREKVTEFLRK